jgi:hypothetical protein
MSDQLTPAEALRLIQLEMDGCEWDSGTMNMISGILHRAGYSVRNPDDNQDED